MKRITLLAALLMGVIVIPTFANDPNTPEDGRRGCCSHHSGVCGCSGGRASCCDGTLSPTCGCGNHDSVLGADNSSFNCEFLDKDTTSKETKETK